MPVFYTPVVNTWHAVIAEIDDSDAPDASNFNLSVEDLADNVAYIHDSYVDGKRGGTYNPTAPIIIGDNGLEMPATAGWWFYGILHFDGTITGGGAPTPTLNFDGTNALLWLTSGAKMQVTASSVVFSAGAGWQMQTGTSASMSSGSELDVASGASIFVAGPGGITVESPGGSIEVQGNAKINLAKGQDLTIADDTNPTFITPRVRSVVQPLLLLPTSSDPTGGASSFDKLDDDGISTSGKNFYIACTRILNGATLSSIVFKAAWTAHGAPPNAASVTIFKTHLTTGARTAIATRTVATTSGTGGTLTLNVPPTEVIDDSLYAYAILYSGEVGAGSGSIVWGPPEMNFTNITDLRSA